MIALPQGLLFLVLGLFCSPLARAAPAGVAEPEEPEEPEEPSPPEECMGCVSSGVDAANTAIGSDLTTGVIVVMLVVIVILTILCMYVHHRRQQKACKEKPEETVSKQNLKSAGFTLGSTVDVGAVDHGPQTAGLSDNGNGQAS